MAVLLSLLIGIIVINTENLTKLCLENYGNVEL